MREFSSCRRKSPHRRVQNSLLLFLTMETRVSARYSDDIVINMSLISSLSFSIMRTWCLDDISEHEYLINSRSYGATLLRINKEKKLFKRQILIKTYLRILFYFFVFADLWQWYFTRKRWRLLNWYLHSFSIAHLIFPKIPIAVVVIRNANVELFKCLARIRLMRRVKLISTSPSFAHTNRRFSLQIF